MNEAKRRVNERKFGQWRDLPGGGRRYVYTVTGRRGWTARYVKDVDDQERTTRFYQEIINPQGNVVEVHDKFPLDSGHRRPGSPT
jgi:hypothetical protein